MEFAANRTVFARFMENGALIWDKKWGEKWLKDQKNGEMR
jgi:hypothetical protein